MHVDARQTAHCMCCHKRFPRNQLRIARSDGVLAEGSNYFLHSSYNSSFWTIRTHTDAGAISIGPFADDCYVKHSSTGNTEKGSQTWTNTTGDGFLVSSSLDLTGWTRLTIAAAIGPYHAQESMSLTYDIRLHDDATASPSQVQTLKTATIRGAQEVWVSIAVADLDAYFQSNINNIFVAFRVRGEVDDKFYLDAMHLEKDTTKPGHFIPTTGASVDRTVPLRTKAPTQICRTCHKYIEKKRDERGRRREMPPDVLRIDIQEI